MNTLKFEIDYDWVPFEVNGVHLEFAQYENNGLRLEKGKCSHWGSVIYKWEGIMTKGVKKGNTGILIGETDNIRARLNQYKTGTQKNGNMYWREEFLRKGKISYWVLNLKKCFLNGTTVNTLQLERKNYRLVLEQLLVMELLSNNDPSQTWIVNKIQ